MVTTEDVLTAIVQRRNRVSISLEDDGYWFVDSIDENENYIEGESTYSTTAHGALESLLRLIREADDA